MKACAFIVDLCRFGRKQCLRDNELYKVAHFRQAINEQFPINVGQVCKLKS